MAVKPSDAPDDWELISYVDGGTEGVRMTPAQLAKLRSVVASMEGGSGVQAAAGIDAHPGDEQLKHYWLFGEGASRWSTWTELYHHLLKYLNPEMAKRTAAEWYHLRYGDWPGSDTNRVRHDKPPRGHRVGPG
jgi:hypothetical protein